MKNRKAEPGEIKKSESFRGEVENRDDVDNPTIHSFESQKYKGGTKWSSKSYKKKTPEINIEDERAGLPTLKSGGLVGKLDKGETVRKTRTTRGGKYITTEKINRPGFKGRARYTTKTLPSGIVKKTTKEKIKTPERIYKEKEVEQEYPSGVSTFKEKSVVKSRYKGEMLPGEGPRKSVTKQEYATANKPRRKSGGLVSKLQNGGLGIQSYDDNLKKGGLAKKARKKY